MNLRIIYFAGLRDLAGTDEEILSALPEQLSVAELVQELLRRRPSLKMQGVRLAVNEEFADDDFSLGEGDVVALIPPVSGG